MSQNSEYHLPVMLTECLEGLEINPDGIYVDVTFGGGGHTRAILEKLSDKGHLYSFDQDDDAVIHAEKIQEEYDNFTFVKANFRHIKRYLKMYRVAGKIDGILADLGISSHQIDVGERGFSTRFDGELDMRMNVQQPLSAKQLVNEYSEAKLVKVLGMYGEVRNARTLANKIISARVESEFETTTDLINVLKKVVPRGKEFRYYAQVFQALRIEVNEEIVVLEEMLEQTPDVLKEGGLLVVMSYHSLEDRLVKNFINKGKFSGDVEKDMYGNQLKPLDACTRKPITASQEELARNNRARSAKLRVARRNDYQVEE